MPLLSLITPLHNKGAYIAETIESVLGQSFLDWEIIIVENHSADIGPKIAKEYAKRDSRIRYFDAPPEIRGPGSARNFGLERATGEWVLFLDADDLVLPGHFENQVELIKSQPDAGLIVCQWLEGRELRDGETKLKYPTKTSDHEALLAAAIAFTPWVPHAAWVRRSALGEGLAWDASLDSFIHEDHIFWFRMLLRTKAIYCDSPGVFYRDEAVGRRNTKSNLPKYLESMDRAVMANLRLLEESGRQLGYAYRKNLMNLYLGLLRFEFSAEHLPWKGKIKSRIQEFRPKLQECLRRHDLVATASFVLPAEWIHKLQVCRRNHLKKS
jgi:glycosyltransferase involved in cell wall biosynthesis